MAYTVRSVRRPTADSNLESVETKLSDPSVDSEDSRIPASPAWNQQIDWSHSTIESSSDEESLPNIMSYTELSASLEDESTSDSEFNTMLLRFQTEMFPLPVSSFRNRSQTFDGSLGTLRSISLQDIHYNDDEADAAKRPASYCIRRGLSNISNKVPSLRSLIIILFSMATLATFLLPYPDFSASAERIMEEKELEGYFITSIRTNHSSATVEYDQAPGRSMKAQPTGSHPRKGRRIAAFARRQKMKFFRKDEVADFYRQKAISQQRMIPWYVNAGILVSVGLWALFDWTRRRKSKPLE